MLLRFAVENHKSINKSQELSLIAASLKGPDYGLVVSDAMPKEYILPSAIIYGPNASGKSNFIKAIKFMRNSVLYSQNRWEADAGIPVDPFLLYESSNTKSSQFEIDFISNGIRYKYGFSCSSIYFAEEWLYSYPEGRARLLFEREKDNNFNFGKSLKGNKNTVKSVVRENSLFLSAAKQNNFAELEPVYQFFQKLKISDTVLVPPISINMEFKDNEIDQRVMAFIASIDTGIDNYRVVESDANEDTLSMLSKFYNVMYEDNENKDKYVARLIEESKKDFKVEFSHKSSDGSSIFFDLEKESTGTRRLIPLLVSAFKTLDDGSILFVDEFDASLHTQICELILALFNDSKINKKGAQLIATTHDTNLLCSKYLRRDQIWLVEKAGGGASELFSLAEVKIRDTDNFEKGYLQGRYGAIPFSGSVEQIIEKFSS